MASYLNKFLEEHPEHLSVFELSLDGASVNSDADGDDEEDEDEDDAEADKEVEKTVSLRPVIATTRPSTSSSTASLDKIEEDPELLRGNVIKVNDKIGIKWQVAKIFRSSGVFV